MTRCLLMKESPRARGARQRSCRWIGVSPFVGLFGTVWGITTLLSIVGSQGEATIKVAGPVE